MTDRRTEEGRWLEEGPRPDYRDTSADTTTNTATLSSVLHYEAGQADERARIVRIIEADVARINGYEKASENGAWYDAGRVDVLTNLLAAIREEDDRCD